MLTLQGRNNIFLSDYTKHDYRGRQIDDTAEVNAEVQRKVDTLKADIAKYVKSEFSDHEKESPFIVTDKAVTFQPVPVVILENGEVEFLCDDINFWIMVLTYEIFRNRQ